MDVQSLVAALGKDDAEIARKLGVDRSTASRLRRGKTRPSFRTMEALLSLQGAALSAAQKARKVRGGRAA